MRDRSTFEEPNLVSINTPKEHDFIWGEFLSFEKVQLDK